MHWISGSRLFDSLESGTPAERVRACVELGRLDDAELALGELAAACPDRTGLEADLACARGDFMDAYRLVRGELGEAREAHARVLATLGRVDAALDLLACDSGPRAARTRARIYLEAGQPAVAVVELGDEPVAAAVGSATTLGVILALLDRAEWSLVRGAALADGGGHAEGLAHLQTARALGHRLGAPSLEARALSRLGEAHADLRQRWRALRAATQALDLVGTGRVDAASLAGIHFRAFQVYGMFGHIKLADRALDSGHHRVVQLASGIDERDYRETFFIDNRENQRLVAAWKGDTEWGSEVRDARERLAGSR